MTGTCSQARALPPLVFAVLTSSARELYGVPRSRETMRRFKTCDGIVAEAWRWSPSSDAAHGVLTPT